MMDANQVWDVPEAIEKTLAPGASSSPTGWRSRPAPTTCSATPPSPRRSRRSGSRPASTARTACCSSSSCRPNAIGVCQVDACRLGGVNEVLAVLLLAAQFGVPVCPHAGGVGLCELPSTSRSFDYICVGASLDGRVLEYVDHLHEHFVDPVRMRGGRYIAPEQPGLLGADQGRRRWTSSSSREAPHGGPDRHADDAGGRRADRGRGGRRAHLPAGAAADAADGSATSTARAACRSTTSAGRTRSSAPRSCSGSPGARPRTWSTSSAARRGSSGCRPATPAPASSSARRSRSPSPASRTRHGHHLLRRPRRAAGGVRDPRPARVRQGPAAAPALASTSATGRRARRRSASCAARRCCSSASARSAPRRRGWRSAFGMHVLAVKRTLRAACRTSTSCTR